MQALSYPEAFKPRPGQLQLIEHLPAARSGDVLSVHWPTGYGKSIGFALAWKHCHQAGIADRLLLIVANDTQRTQIVNDFAGDCELVGAPCSGGVWSYERSAADLMAARSDRPLVFVSTVQQLSASYRGGHNLMLDMLTLPDRRWMIGFDEFHHYGEDLPWGKAAVSAMEHARFTLAMSATPYRRGSDTVFPEPDLSVSYEQAVQEQCVKPMQCNAYEYTVSVKFGDDKQPVEYTTNELMNMARSDISAWEERRQIRYSSRYIQAMTYRVIDRLREKRAATGLRLQLLVRAMSCLHAKAIADEMKPLLDDLTVDWIGTGDNGRKDEENGAVLRKFCPPKVNGVRPEPELDVLVQVAMAGEGFDSINVVEIMDLFPCSAKASNGRAVQDKQFYGRGARVISGAEDMRLHVNVPTDHPLFMFDNMNLHRWMDSCGEQVIPDERDATGEREYDLFNLPPLPLARDVRLAKVHVPEKVLAYAMEKMAGSRDPSISDDQFRAQVYQHCHDFMAGLATEQSAQCYRAQLKQALDHRVGRLALVMVRYAEKVAGSAVGDNKKSVNARLKRVVGAPREVWSNDDLMHGIRAVDQWIKEYER